MKRLSGTDRALARRIECGHAHSGAAYVKARPQGEGAVEATEDGGWAMFQGAGMPTTQALAMGMCGEVTEAGLARVESFFWSRGSACVIDLCTLVHPTLMAMLDERGYRVREVSNVLARLVDSSCAFSDSDGIERVDERDLAAFGSLIARGFLESDDVPEEMTLMTSTLPEGALAWTAGDGVAGAMMIVNDGLATLTGDATLVRARGQGMQLRLIRHRLGEALKLGCDLASASVMPGSASHRNYERAGFELLYARVMVYRPAPC
jgi:hypothetical protein